MKHSTVLLALVLCAVTATAAPEFAPSNLKPPAVPREFRGAWVASVSNIDWPSRRGLTTAQQQAELLALLDRAAQLHLNAVLLQVRPACDALYASRFEPWSEYLTGQMGRAPEPFYDPLEFAVREAHRRGLELHAWFNPYRARHTSGKSSVARDHVSRAQPHLVRAYGKQLWLDPGEKAVQQYSLDVILDVVRRYDLDGVHLDDYFYPYAEKDAAGRALDFPDADSWRKYTATGGKLARDDWRRHNVDTFIERLYRAIKAEKAWVKFGVSPFGIWRPGQPAQIKGLDAYARLYADSRKWFAEGWVDYLTPQLYWAAAAREQSYPVLLNWWAAQNQRQRHLWPGNSHRNDAAEILNQIRLTRQQPGASGNVHWSVKSLLQNKGGVADRLQEIYAAPALVPASPWLTREPVAPPTLTASSSGLKLSWQAAGTEPVRLWVLQTKTAGAWRTEILPGARTTATLTGAAPEALALTALDRAGNASAPTVLAKPNGSPPTDTR